MVEVTEAAQSRYVEHLTRSFVGYFLLNMIAVCLRAGRSPASGGRVLGMAAPPIRNAGSAEISETGKLERRKAVEPVSRLYGLTVIAS
ncbi:hypothetical protein [Oceaniradius stylonematis]|uniref:hypothetical protein n=1 Tax=Oceaniradius stylonematis TaxID=2184161 RepID=UPI00273F7C4C|nr:hypothetical protein [Oceaniradius stylonematis]